MKAALSIVLAVCINLMLFYLIYRLVTPAHTALTELPDFRMVEFVRVQREPEMPEPDRRRPPPEQPPPPERPPRQPEVQPLDPDKPPPQQLHVPATRVDVPLRITGGPYLGEFQVAPVAPAPAPAQFDEEVVPTLRIPPDYPPRAMRAGIEGVVTVEFTILADGSVRDPAIVKADPPGVFDQAVLRAITRWKFKPKVVDGQAVERRARQDVRFSLSSR